MVTKVGKRLNQKSLYFENFLLKDGTKLLKQMLMIVEASYFKKLNFN